MDAALAVGFALLGAYLVLWFFVADRILARARQHGVGGATCLLLAAVALVAGRLDMAVAWYASGRMAPTSG